jgi:hypothetical protein
MVSIWREQGREAEKGGVEDLVGKRLTRGATERATGDSQAAQLRSMLARVREADNGAMLRGTPVGCWQKVKAEGWLSEQQLRLAVYDEAAAEGDRERRKAMHCIKGARALAQELLAVLRGTAQRAQGIERRWKKWLVSAGQ